MKLYGIYFSPTGGTKEILDLIMEPWQLEKQLIDITVPRYKKRYTFQADDICIIATPTFGGRVPELVCQRLKLLSGQKTRCILVAVYGNRAYEDTLLELKAVTTPQNMEPIAAISAVSIHSILNQFGDNRPNDLDKMELTIFSQEIINLINSDAKIGPLKVPGNYPYREYRGLILKPTANRHCTGCGLCLKVCPVGAISLDKIKKVDRQKCISCMRCVAVCPNEARRINPLLLKVAGKMLEKECSVRKENELYFELEE